MLQPKTKHQANKTPVINWIGRDHPRELNPVSQNYCACSFVFFLDRKEPNDFQNALSRTLPPKHTKHMYTYHKLLHSAVYFSLRKEEKHRQTTIV